MEMMNFQQALEKLEQAGKLEHVFEAVSLNDISKRITNGEPVLFESTGTIYKLAANVCSKQNFEAMFEHSWIDIRNQFAKALENPGAVEATDDFPFEEAEADFDSLPILQYYKGDGGKYLTSAVYITESNGVRNLAYHRTMIIDKNTAVVRLCHRHTWENYEESGEDMDVAICLGLDPAILSVAAMSTKEHMDETTIAAGFYEKPIKMVKMPNGISVPQCAEIVLVGKLVSETAKEGPFVDATGTVDYVRDQPVFKLEKIFHRPNPIFYALVPGRGEHSFLMGVSKEPIIFKEVSKSVDLVDVAFTDGGINWLAAALSIRKKSNEDVKKAVEAAFAAHNSLKHVFVFDEDINIADPEDRFWAFTTRFQADKDIITFPGAKGSSLDPSSEPGEDRRITCKAGFDCTISMDKDKKDFLKVE